MNSKSDAPVIKQFFLVMFAGTIMIGFTSGILGIVHLYIEPEIGKERAIGMFMFVLFGPAMIAGAAIGKWLVKKIWKYEVK